MRYSFVFFFSTFLVLGSLRAAVDPEAGTRGLLGLYEAGNARALAMGSAFSSISDDANAAFYNPATLGELDYIEATFSRQDQLQSVNLNQAAVAVPFKDFTSSNLKSYGTLAVTATFLDYGDFKQTDASGNATGRFDAEDVVFSVSYGKRIFNQLSVGARVKKGESSIAEVDADFTTTDIGVLFLPGPTWNVGAYVENLGGRATFQNESFTLPKRFIAGLSGRPWKKNLLLSGEIVDSEDYKTSLRSGIEYDVNSVFTLRAGYRTDKDLSPGFSGGAGFHIRNAETFFFPFRTISIDYAFLSLAAAEEEGSNNFLGSHHVSLSLEFGEDGTPSR